MPCNIIEIDFALGVNPLFQNYLPTISQPANTCSKLRVDTLEQWTLTLNIFNTCSSVSIAYFKQVNASWVIFMTRFGWPEPDQNSSSYFLFLAANTLPHPRLSLILLHKNTSSNQDLQCKFLREKWKCYLILYFMLCQYLVVCSLAGIGQWARRCQRRSQDPLKPPRYLTVFSR